MDPNKQKRLFQFRVWDYDTNKMYYKAGLAVGENCLSACNGIVMQSTNRFDVENNPVFEGDVLEVFHTSGHTSEFECIWDEHELGFKLISATRDGDEYGVYTLNFNQRHPRKIRIVRNIYEGAKV